MQIKYEIFYNYLIRSDIEYIEETIEKISTKYLKFCYLHLNAFKKL